MSVSSFSDASKSHLFLLQPMCRGWLDALRVQQPFFMFFFFAQNPQFWIVTEGQVHANLRALVFSLLTKSRNRRINCGRGSGRSKIAIMQTMLATQPRRLVTRMSQYDFQNHFIRPSSWRAACFLALVFTYIVCHAWLHDWSGNESLFLVFVFSFFGTEW